MNIQTSPQPDIDLSECERELIHIPGSIQPHGILLAIRETDWTILRVSENADQFFEMTVDQLLGSNLAELFDTKQLEALLATRTTEPSTIPFRFTTPSTKRDFNESLSGVVHRSQDCLIIELEARPPLQSEALAALQQTLHLTMATLEKSDSLAQLCQLAAQQVRSLTGYDRVMIYKFDRDWHGEVIAEAKTEDLESYLGLHYPASDIPPQARELYRRNRLRIIPDIDYQPIPIRADSNVSPRQPLDLSLSILRSVSPIHIEYLRNMGVQATMTISLIHDHQLWGLIACHHYSPKVVSIEVRNIAELLSQILSLLFFQKEDSFNDKYRLRLRTVQERLYNAVTSTGDDVVTAFTGQADDLLELVGASGAAVCFGGKMERVGRTPSPEQIQQICDWLAGQERVDPLFQTDTLARQFPAAAAIKDVASGLLALSLSDAPGDFLLWFRPEVIQTVTWGGNPNKPVMVDKNGYRLSPRKSFEAWKEVVRFRAKPWHSAELAAAESLHRLHSFIEQQRHETIIHRQAQVFANVRDGIVLLDLDGLILDWNRGAEHTFGYTKAETVTRPVVDILRTVPPEQIASILEQVARRNEWLGETTVLHKAGEQRIVDVVVTVLTTSQNHLEALIIVARDVTERKALEQRLQHAQKMEAVGELAGGVAHNFNNLLTALVGYTEFALQSIPTDHPVSNDLRNIQQVAHRATSLTQQLLTFTRLQRSTSPTRLDLNDLITGVERMLRQLISANIELTTRLAADLGYILADAGQIEQILINLIVNARDAMPEGGVLTIETFNSTLDSAYAQRHSDVTPGEYVTLIISDTGIGMSEAIRQRIFEPFFTTKDVGRGTGLGLATCFGIVRQHKGYIGVQSRPNQGTVFTIHLPRLTTADPAPTPVEKEAPLPRGSETILLVEDETTIRELAERALRQQGYNVLSAGHGLEALQLLSEQNTPPVQLLITDVMMPKMGGQPLAEQLRARQPDLKVLFIFGYADAVSQLRQSPPPHTAFLDKPFTPHDLLDMVRRLLDAHF